MEEYVQLYPMKSFMKEVIDMYVVKYSCIYGDLGMFVCNNIEDCLNYFKTNFGQVTDFYYDRDYGDLWIGAFKSDGIRCTWMATKCEVI